ncbi:MAG: FAD-dependent oxidoreductase [Gammaproteobacteria bacterium]|nr:FAD-dependent oxidoreductase [Gammaproteobacteria bacterium]
MAERSIRRRHGARAASDVLVIGGGAAGLAAAAQLGAAGLSVRLLEAHDRHAAARRAAVEPRAQALLGPDAASAAAGDAVGERAVGGIADVGIAPGGIAASGPAAAGAADAAGRVEFDPLPRRLLRPLARLGAGPVIKAVLTFREAFWEMLDRGRYARATFFHALESSFPTFWTARPVRAPVVVAWCAGPAAARLAGSSPQALRERALESFQSLWRGRVDVRALLHSVQVHDWVADPFSRSAYSYVRVDGGDARGELARPLRDTLYFAGEACDPGEEGGTVAGALNSGAAAAARLLCAQGRARPPAARARR